MMMKEQNGTVVAKRQIASGWDIVIETSNESVKKRIAIILERYRSGEIDIISYLDGISQNIKVWTKFQTATKCFLILSIAIAFAFISI